MTKTFKYSDTLINAAFCFLLLALLLAIGGTLAQVNNALKKDENVGYMDARLVQTYGGNGDTHVYPGFTQERTCQATNYGTEVAFLRLRVDKYWADRSWGDGGEVFTRNYDPQYDANLIEITFDDTENWVDGEDGWFYYATTVAPGEETTNLLSAVGISEQVGEENNDAKQTRKDHDNKTSIYIDKAGVVDVELQAVTTEYDYSKDGTGDEDSAGSGSKFAAADLKSQFSPETGDSISNMALLLFALAALSLCVFVVLLIASKRRNDKNEQAAQAANGYSDGHNIN